MPLPYSLFVRHELYEVLRRIRPAWRSKLIHFLESLAANPDHSGDYTERDPSDRVLQIKVIGPWAVVYWSDHAVCEVKIVQIVSSDR